MWCRCWGFVQEYRFVRFVRSNVPLLFQSTHTTASRWKPTFSFHTTDPTWRTTTLVAENFATAILSTPTHYLSPLSWAWQLPNRNWTLSTIPPFGYRNLLFFRIFKRPNFPPTQYQSKMLLYGRNFPKRWIFWWNGWINTWRGCMSCIWWYWWCVCWLGLVVGSCGFRLWPFQLSFSTWRAITSLSNETNAWTKQLTYWFKNTKFNSCHTTFKCNTWLNGHNSANLDINEPCAFYCWGQFRIKMLLLRTFLHLRVPLNFFRVRARSKADVVLVVCVLVESSWRGDGEWFGAEMGHMIWMLKLDAWRVRLLRVSSGRSFGKEERWIQHTMYSWM